MINPDTMDVNAVLTALESLGSQQTKRTYMNHGAREPLFGVKTGQLKPLARKIRRNHALAMELYATGNYDAMYLAGMIADPKAMTEADIESWMRGAYFHGLSDYVVAIALAQADFAQDVADRWIRDDRELYQSAGWTCYALMIGVRPDDRFDRVKIGEMLGKIERTIHSSPNYARYAMNGFLIAAGIHYPPLHEEALRIAGSIGEVKVDMGRTGSKVPPASAYIQKAVDAGRIGSKRKKVRC